MRSYIREEATQYRVVVQLTESKPRKREANTILFTALMLSALRSKTFEVAYSLTNT